MRQETESSNVVASVAMITYNHSGMIGKAMESVIRQECRFPFELIVGEDCSTDATRGEAEGIARRHPDKIRIIWSNANVGAHGNLKRVELACRGRYIAYCEGDDFWHDRFKLAKQVEFLEHRQDYSMVHSHCDRLYLPTGRLVRSSLQVPVGLNDDEGYQDIMLSRRYPLTVTVVARRQMVHRIIADCPECTDSKWPLGDTQRWLELSRLGKVGCVHESLATTTLLPESASQSRSPARRLKFFLAVRDLKLHYLKKYPLPEHLSNEVRRILTLALLRYAYFAADGAVATRLFEEYRQLNGVELNRARWLRWGSQSVVRQQLIGPIVKLDSRWRRWMKARSLSEADLAA